MRPNPAAPTASRACIRMPAERWCQPIEPKHFSVKWNEGLRALGLRQRGLYSTKHIFVTLTLATAREDVTMWVVKQTGVAYETLRQHYEAWLPKRHGSMWEKIDPSLTATKPKRLTVVG